MDFLFSLFSRRVGNVLWLPKGIEKLEVWEELRFFEIASGEWEKEA